jgi:hypothetical protein
MLTRAPETRLWTATRIETWATPGVPDVDLCDDLGRFHKIELKVSATNKVDLRPHQVAYMTRHRHASVWIMVSKGLTLKKHELYLYHGQQAVDVAMDGLKTPPVVKIESSDDWGILWKTIAGKGL